MNSELKGNDIKIRRCYYFDDIINNDNFDLDSILFDQKSFENILICHAAYKTPDGVKPIYIYISFLMHHYLLMKNIREFLIELDILLC